MGLSLRHSLLRKLQAEVPRGAPFDLGSLHRLGISTQLAAKYVTGGWLVRLGQGVYAFPGDQVTRDGAVLFLQERVEGLHVGGRSSLALQGVRHQAADGGHLVLWGNRRFVLPDWFTGRFPSRYVSARLFDWTETGLGASTIGTPAGATPGLWASVRERAVLELLHDVGTKEDFAGAFDVFTGLHDLRGDLLGRLLSCCTSVKTVRLFLSWARQTNLLDVDSMLRDHEPRTGGGGRWVSRMKDGSLLALKRDG